MPSTEGLSEEINRAFQYRTWYFPGHAAPSGQSLLNPWVVHLDTLFWTWVAMAILIVFALYLRSRLTMIPKPYGAQNFLEWIWEFHARIAHDLLGEEAWRYMPVVVTIFLFVLLGNLFGLIPTLIPYTRDANTTVGLALYSFFAFNYYAIKKKGFWQWVLHFTHPIPTLRRTLEGKMKYIMIPPLFVLFVVLNFVEETARIISLSMRLFGNIMGKHIVMAVLFGLAVFLTMPFHLNWILDVLPLFVWLIGLIAAIVQAMIFSLLSLAYIAIAVGEHH